MTDPWKRYSTLLCRYPDLGITVDPSRMRFADSFLSEVRSRTDEAFAAMARLEAGEIANPDEKRMVGHYWLRAPELAPTEELRDEIRTGIEQVKAFAAAVHEGTVAPVSGGRFRRVLLVGIGGSALGPQLVADCLAGPSAPMSISFFDNTDPDGMALELERIGDGLASTLCVVVSKSGGTKETRNGMLVAADAYAARGLEFARHAVAVTGPGSQLDQLAESEGWIARFPMADWVGGRTSVMSVVGLLPAALQGVDIDSFLAGAADMDERTRRTDVATNAAMLLALMWYAAGRGRGEKDMVVIPYRDRLVLLSKYLQQLVMESLGKEHDLDGRIVHQGIAVYGNKGATDQHAYVQQLRDGVNNFFVTFIEVREAAGAMLEVEPGVTSGDYLQGFLRGTRAALAESDRESITISVPRADARNLGALIALFERAVGFYASLVNINAYHQPGVEAGKRAAGAFLDLLGRVRAALGSESRPAGAIAAELAADPEDVYHALVHMSANDPGVHHEIAGSPADDTFRRG